MTDRHPLVLKWAIEHARARDLFDRGKGPHVWGFNNLDFRQHRLLSRIFFAVEKDGVVPGSFGYPEFHFVYQGMIFFASLGPIDRYSRNAKTKLRFVIYDPNVDEPAVHSEWLDDPILLEDRIPEIAAGIVAVARAVARAIREKFKSALDAKLLRVLDGLKRLEALADDSSTARSDPRTFEALVEMAERHWKAVLVRHFLRALSKTITDGTVEIAGHSLDDWMTWAAAKTDAFDPLVQGAENIFAKVVKF
ncbi:hypothetical protein [Hyphomicrobium denitrificans]|uniref:hypothetical protein n=1 Tax=Hyphomicrobium denitrificans TaxID=53399 RepID=UPI00022E8269|nr:hypothetical protein [Hyphomicrobium denitrificans]